MLKWAFICTLFLLGLYFSLNYSALQFQEGFATRCPDVLVQDGEELILKNTKLADIPGVNPVRFKNLEEYTQFMHWQQSQNIKCPVLFYQKTFDAQNQQIYMERPPPQLRSIALSLETTSCSPTLWYWFSRLFVPMSWLCGSIAG